jgi:methylenetetrahydrofolate dehydrogenase (NADP+)/methenyltetrahydrofolate cyclohydrolase
MERKHVLNMSQAQRLDGKKVSQLVLGQVEQWIKETTLAEPPHLAVILVGDDPASQVYVNKKAKTAEKLGMKSTVLRLPASTSEQALLTQIDTLNQNPAVHAILLQLPLPVHINTYHALERISPVKDVDGFHPMNQGLLFSGRNPVALPCTPAGMMTLVQAYGLSPKGKHVVVVGRSNIVGKPIAHLMLQQHATVTIAHSQTEELPALIATADWLVAAVGKPNMVTGNMLKPGAVVLDVGINRLPDGRLVGDVDFESALSVASYITPVPGGVGLMTIATLMQNTQKLLKASMT